MSNGRDIVLSGAILAAETLSALSLPGASVVDKAVTGALDRRAKVAREVLLESISKEGVDEILQSEQDLDEFVQMMMRFSKCANEGAARQNLKLLAQVISGLKKNHILKFDKFQSCANVIEALTRDEILFLGKLKIWSKSNPDDIKWIEFRSMLAHDLADLDINACASALSRTGMILPVSAFGTMVYVPTKMFYEVCSLAEFENAS